MHNPILIITRQLHKRSNHRRLPPCIAIIDTPGQVPRHIPAHSLVILRTYNCPEQALYAPIFAQYCRKNKWRLLLAGNPSLAIKLHTAGIHVPEFQLHTIPVWRKKKPGWLITTAAHSEAALRQAARYGADAALYSPIFPTLSHPEAHPLGVIRFNNIIRKTPLPVYALGGVTTKTVVRLRNSCAVGVAGIRAWV